MSNTTSEAQLHQVAIYPLVPSSGCLFQPIEGFLQSCRHGCPDPGLPTPKVAPHISLPLLHHAEKCSLHIIWWRLHPCVAARARSNGGISSHRCKYVIIVYTFLTGNESCLELFSTSNRSMLDLVEPFRGDNCFVLRSWNHIPDVILHNGLIASFHTWCFTTSLKDSKLDVQSYSWLLDTLGIYMASWISSRISPSEAICLWAMRIFLRPAMILAQMYLPLNVSFSLEGRHLF